MAKDKFKPNPRFSTEWLKSRTGDYLIVLALCVIAVWPFVTRAGLPRATDAELHIFRLAELGRLVGEGVLYPRWAPNFYFGYGYPIFNYYAPLAYYIGLPLELLPAIDAVQAVKAVFVFSLLVGALGMFGFVRGLWGRTAGFIAAASYAYAPYVQYIDPHARGDLAEALSFGLFPLALWSISTLLRQRSPWAWLVTTLSTAAVILSHNLMAIVFFAILVAWTIWPALLGWSTQRRKGAKETDVWERILPVPSWPSRNVSLSLVALLVAVGLTAFFWLPVALEQGAVNLGNLIGEGGHFDFRNHFLTMRELLGPSGWLDWGATEPAFALNLGVAQWLLGLLGLAALLTKQARRSHIGAFFAVAALILIFMMTEASTLLWERVPLLAYLQFPWRLLGPAAAVLAVLAGLGGDAAQNLLRRAGPQKGGAGRRLRAAMLARWLPVLIVAYIMVLALPLAMVPPWSAERWDTSALGVLAIERQGRWLGTTSTADFVPATVEVVPNLDEQMLDSFQTGDWPNRVNRVTLPDDVSVESRTVTPLHTRYLVSADEPFLLRLFLFSFPGWQARIDGQAVPTELGRPEGLLVVPVPAGDHVVDVAFVNTPARLVAWAVSAVALILTAAMMIFLRRTEAPAGQKLPVSGSGTVSSSGRHRLTPLLLLAAVAALVLPLAQATGLFHLESTGNVAIPAEHDVHADFGGQLALIGYDAPDRIFPGDSIAVTLYWKAQREMDINFQVFLHLLGPEGAPVAQSDKLNPGEFPTKRWPLHKYVRDVHRLAIPQSLPPGRYRLSTGMWVQEEGWRLPLFDENERQIGDHFVFEEFRLR